MKMAFRACRDKTSVLYSVLLNNAAIVREKGGQSDQAIRDFEQCAEIREKQLSSDHEELANVYNNLSMPLMSKRRFDESEGLLRRAPKIDSSKDETSQLKILHTRYMNLGCLYALMGRFDESRVETEKGRQYVLRQFGDNSYYIATCERYTEYVDYKQGFIDQARQKYTRAYSILSNIYLVHSTISSTLYMLGCVENEAGNIAASIGWLEKTVHMAKRNVPGRKDEGEVARASRKLSDALRLAGRVEEADRMHCEAEDTRTRLQGAGMEDTEQNYDLLVPAQFRT
ncbi:hypothetical protein B0H67DRAFT_264161 [Lasiosphaeris hirsuta]|uniref:Tetratricopeptide repeat protein n=1 Tax=Lasiosphaeris hirsuta TaxID=260670 RepID=A0AA40A7M4_9PEZI|nr:hypothetical protein B0H67DRAFT_264161 [Lasiosphaeris hirsuta]